MPIELTESEFHATLADKRRRLILRCLQESGTPLPLSTLADRIARYEFTGPSEDDQRAIRISLHHAHVPYLEDLGIISYDRDTTRVRRGPNFEKLVACLESPTVTTPRTYQPSDIPTDGRRYG
ncbi:DUF7344 domain-containing protein [Halovivax gelatinilyticus]|uniref:DUF7344 domain-containing protein n=1 Tax=Halovivax gelatinilyticus TaxID=2961597 RepID=UPI0020CA4548|nr:hypothetical protein [Halovivax gelatinilyticus]